MVLLSLEAASAMVFVPVSSDSTIGISRIQEGFVSGQGIRRDPLSRPCVLAGREDCVGVAVSDRIVAFAGIMSALRGHAADLLAFQDLFQQIG